MLALLPEASVDCCVTSPPYWGLRDYGLNPVEWPDGWIGCLGLEPEPDQYVEHLVAVFDSAARVLKPTGTVWLNLGDTYCNCSPVRKRSGDGMGTEWDRDQAKTRGGPRRYPRFRKGRKMKDLEGIPWLVAFALREAGWYLRSDIIWAKGVSGQREITAQVAEALDLEGIEAETAARVLARLEPYVGGCMPENVKDRPTRSHEYMFLLGHPASRGKYYCDMSLVREDARWAGKGKTGRGPGAWGVKQIGLLGERANHGRSSGVATGKDTRNRRSVWTVNTESYEGAHFAVFPPALIKPCIQAGSQKGGVVLDPFGGRGTTAAAALVLGRHAVYIDASEEYIRLAAGYLRGVSAEFLSQIGPRRI